MINTLEFARRHFGMFVSRWNQTEVHAEGGPPSARFRAMRDGCSVTAILSCGRSVLRLAILAYAVTPHRTLVLK